MKTNLSILVLVSSLVACGGTEPPAAAPTQSSTVVTSTPPTAGASAAASTDPSGAPVNDAEKVISAMRPDFRQCYNDGLKKDAKLEGSVMIEAKVGPKGEVVSTTASETQGLTPEVVECMSKRVKAGTFAPPGDKGSTVRVPVKFKSGS